MILFTKPKASQGKGYLRLDKNLWFYDPSVGKWERRTERERIGGTDSPPLGLRRVAPGRGVRPRVRGRGEAGRLHRPALNLKGKPGSTWPSR